MHCCRWSSSTCCHRRHRLAMGMAMALSLSCWRGHVDVVVRLSPLLLCRCHQWHHRHCWSWWWHHRCDHCPATSTGHGGYVDCGGVGS